VHGRAGLVVQPRHAALLLRLGRRRLLQLLLCWRWWRGPAGRRLLGGLRRLLGCAGGRRGGRCCWWGSRRRSSRLLRRGWCGARCGGPAAFTAQEHGHDGGAGGGQGVLHHRIRLHLEKGESKAGWRAERAATAAVLVRVLLCLCGSRPRWMIS
jgi:hypothetical protein